MDGAEVIRDMIDAVWRRGEIDALDAYWADDCLNHAAPPDASTGLAALATYHRGFATQFEGFSDVAISIVQQVEQADRVATQLVTTGRHDASGRRVSMTTMRIDRIEAGRIAEHWSVADLAGLAAQLGG